MAWKTKTLHRKIHTSNSAGRLSVKLIYYHFKFYFLSSPSPHPFFSAPAPYVKVYLLDNGTCKAKKKTKIARKTLEPLYQQHLLFEESPQGKVLQVTGPDYRSRTITRFVTTLCMK